MEFTLTNIVYVATIIGVFGTAIKMMYSAKVKMEEPYNELSERIDHHEKCLKRDNERLEKLEEKMEITSEDNRQILLVLETMLSHMETGNNTGQIKLTRTELNQYLIRRK